MLAKTVRLGVISLLTLSAIAAQASPFKVKFTNLGPQGLSPIFVSTSNANFDTFDLGGTASSDIERVAEGGDAMGLVGSAMAHGANVADYALASGPLAPGAMWTVELDADPTRGILSFVTMLGRTNDGWLGSAAGDEQLDLFVGNIPQSFVYIVTGREAWDAGTEANTENAADLGFLGGANSPHDYDNRIRVHQSILGVGDASAQMPDWGMDDELLRIEVTAVPEPGTLAALGLGAAAFLRRKRR